MEPDDGKYNALAHGKRLKVHLAVLVLSVDQFDWIPFVLFLRDCFALADTLGCFAEARAGFFFGLGSHCLDLEGFDAEGEFDGARGRAHHPHLLARDLQLVLLQAT